MQPSRSSSIETAVDQNPSAARGSSMSTLPIQQRQRSTDVEAGIAPDPSSQPDSAPVTEKEKYPNDTVVFDGPDDPENPQNWPKRRKLFLTMLYGLNTMTSTFASSIFSSATTAIARDYGISNEVAILGLSLFLLGFALGPVLFGPLSEVYGRKTAILLPTFVFACFSAATATAENLQTIFITRFFGGVFAASPVTIVGGGIADLFNQRQRGTYIVVYSLCIVGGPTVAPVIGSAVSESYLTWRWTEYLCVIMTSTILVMDYFFLPETSANEILTKKARRLRLETGRWSLHSKHEETDHSISAFLHKMLFLPLQMLVKEPMVLAITLYNGFAYGILYMLFAAIPIVFGEVRGWPPVTAALPNLATLVGALSAALINYIYSERFFGRYLDTHNNVARPEKRLPPMMIGAVCFPVGFFIVGWTSKKSINFFPSLIGFTLIGMSFLLIFQAGLNYLIDGYTKVSASAVAANTFVRSMFGAALPLVATPLFHNLGVDWACTLLGLIALVLGFTPYLFYVFGPRIRARSNFIANHKI